MAEIKERISALENWHVTHPFGGKGRGAKLMREIINLILI
jgi:hypothetical protein